MSDINWGKFPVMVSSISSVLLSLSSPSGVSIRCVTPFRVAPTAFEYSVLFPSLCSLCFSSQRILLRDPQTQRISQQLCTVY